ncbi:oxysterol-binding protein-related protein 9 isoform X2 [Ctenocephalides felis]|uniref:oxysterol-binding protein-related protein 9 isoform X2 n=1 Tax=Ctenocephalides felis TaxID=7515 RepID=UPI000E6E4095|nr:oxysterol-binding protein-related protein 9 isoform X2 [Ctenocephalides felis]
MEGSLSKWTNVMKGWQYRWFVLDENAGLLSYYTSKEKMMRGVRRGCVRLRSAVIGIDDEDDSTFTITVDHKTFHFQARDGEERENWVRALEDTILRHSERGQQWSGQQQRTQTVKDFDKKVSEADAYLQLMIEQNAKLEMRVKNIPDDDDRAKCKVISDHSNAMLDNIKHSIVLLQIAKNTAHPINGVYQGPTSSSISTSTSQTAPINTSGNTMTLSVPATSYSSSEGEEDFYDANEDIFSPGTPTSSGSRMSLPEFTKCSVPNMSNYESNAESAFLDDGKRSGTPPISQDGELDYDALYEVDDEEDMGSMETHGSVVTHLLSQVKIGMDLTKVVLPTFILERRSLLEMYADYFAHPDAFVKIADLKDPRDRMVQVVRWYLSSYHAGRKSAVAKKPYNPILGEIFKCHWDIDKRVEKSDALVSDGPIPWCNRDQLTFIAEQVSHHPPISAFYAEHYNKKISFCAHVWTKSKFLGLSIGVHNIGEGRVKVIDYGEEYVVTFPNGYGRSILTVPWIELGGSVTISCAQTGYQCNIEFLTKPFYGGKKHKITADVFSPTDKKKPFLSINGEWNARMEAKWSDGRTETFFDVNNVTVIKKIVRPIAQQDQNESRYIWKEVTAGLTLNDIDRATTAKSTIEQKQRDLVQQRKDENEEWQTKMFRKHGEKWYYVSPLEERLETTGN